MRNKIQTPIMIGLLVVSTITCMAQATLEVTVDNIREIKGSIRVGLSITEKQFPDTPGEGKAVRVQGQTATVVFEGIKPGEYAISVFHDKNNNGELDTNAIGIPQEAFGFGNNVMGMFGPPSFEKAKVTLARDPVKHTITLKHF